jgi:hypothetical protein
MGIKLHQVGNRDETGTAGLLYLALVGRMNQRFTCLINQATW